mgnify:CR=1 FL=1
MRRAAERAVDFLLRILMFNLGPTVLELVLAAAVTLLIGRETRDASIV